MKGFVGEFMNKARNEAIKEIVNKIQWVQEYIIAVGEEHKQTYVDTLEEIMKMLMEIANNYHA